MIFRKITDGEDLRYECNILTDESLLEIRKKIGETLWQNDRNINERNIILKYNNVTLDVNKTVLEQVGSQNVLIDCDIIENRINSTYLLNLSINKQGRSQRLIEIDRGQLVDELKQYLCTLLNTEVIAVLKDRQSLDGSLGSYSLADNDNIIAVTVEEGSLCVYRILLRGECVSVPYFNDEQVIDLKRRVALKIKCNIDDFVMFYDDHWLEEANFLYQYEIDNNSVIRYCFFDKIGGVDRITPMNVCGSFSVLYEGRIVSTGQEITIKKYNCSGISQSVENYKPMIRELVTFARTRDTGDYRPQNASRIVQLISFYRDADAFYIGMEYMRGGSIHAQVADRFPLPSGLIAKWTRQILEGLVYLHGLNIIHRDLKTSNVLLDEYGEVKISGFSLSKYLMGDPTSALSRGFVQSKAGTYNFMAPEVFNMEDSGTKVDIWSVGAILVELVTGRIPYGTLNEIDASVEIATSRTIVFDMPARENADDLARLIGHCLRANPRERLRAEELLNDPFIAQLAAITS